MYFFNIIYENFVCWANVPFTNVSIGILITHRHKFLFQHDRKIPSIIALFVFYPIKSGENIKHMIIHFKSVNTFVPIMTACTFSLKILSIYTYLLKIITVYGKKCGVMFLSLFLCYVLRIF